MRLLPCLLAVAAPLAAQPVDVFDHPPEAYLGAAVCGGCHVEKLESQARSGHALSLATVADHRLAASFQPLRRMVRDGGADYSYSAAGSGLRVEVTKGDGGAAVDLEWAFGAGEQAVTFVGQFDEDRYVEHHFSYYAAADALATTPGHRDRPPDDPEAALGVFYQTFGPEPAIMRCFQCHSTGPLELGSGYSLRPRELGVRCEACHGPGRGHVEGIAAGDLERALAAVSNPGRLSGDQLLRFCGDCHRPPASTGEVIDWSDPWNVRHQPVFLSRSACTEDGGQALACMRCHDPHEPLSRAAARQDGLCMECHIDSRPPATVCRQSAGRTCSSCHMPAVRPQDNLRFTNHWIGVYNPRRPLRPRE